MQNDTFKYFFQIVAIVDFEGILEAKRTVTL